MTALQVSHLAARTGADSWPISWGEPQSSIPPLRLSPSESGLSAEKRATSSTSLDLARVLQCLLADWRATADWLDETLQDLARIAEGLEVDGPPPTEIAIREARAFLKQLARSVADTPSLADDPAEAIGIELYGTLGSRVLFVIEHDGQATYYEHIGGMSGRARFPTWQVMMKAIGWGGLERSGVRLID